MIGHMAKREENGSPIRNAHFFKASRCAILYHIYTTYIIQVKESLYFTYRLVYPDNILLYPKH